MQRIDCKQGLDLLFFQVEYFSYYILFWYLYILVSFLNIDAYIIWNS